MKPRVVCAMSGGVDSSVAAALLVEQGFDVVGLFMRSGASGNATGEKQGCCSVEDAADARRVADQLKVPFYALNMEAEFGRVIDHFVDGYARGLTPNPCVMCNRWLKLGHVLSFAKKIGAERVATGHYARLARDGDRLTLARARDARKDQSYVLAVLTPEQLARVDFPLGDLEKDEVRALAARFGLARVAAKAESQEICFVPGDYRDLVRARLPAQASAAQAGDVVDTSGRVVARHDGTLGYTIGQRAGIGGRPLRTYVVDVRPETRTVVIGSRDETLVREIAASGGEWPGRAELAPGERVRGRAQVRAHHRAIAATAIGGDEPGAFTVQLDVAEAGVAPGQLLVLYDDDDARVLGSGWIAR